jgi:hypothetical protein
MYLLYLKLTSEATDIFQELAVPLIVWVIKIHILLSWLYLFIECWKTIQEKPTRVTQRQSW